MKSLWRFVGVVLVFAAVWGGAWLFVPPPQATMADDERAGQSGGPWRVEPVGSDHWIWREVPAQPQQRTAPQAPASVPPTARAGQPAPARVLVAAGGETAARATAVVSIDWGNPDRLVQDVARIWPKLRPNPLRVRRYAQASDRTSADDERGQDDAPEAPVLVATRPGRIYIVSDDPDAVATLKAVLKAFQPTPRMQGLPLEARRFEHAEATDVAEEIEDFVAKQGARPAQAGNLSDRGDQGRGPLIALRNITPQSIRIHADATSNTLVYQAHPRERAILERVLRRLEQPAEDDAWDDQGSSERAIRDEPQSTLEPEAQPRLRRRGAELSEEDRRRILEQFAKKQLQIRKRSDAVLGNLGTRADFPALESRPSGGLPVPPERSIVDGNLGRTVRPQRAERMADDRLIDPPSPELPDASGPTLTRTLSLPLPGSPERTLPSGPTANRAARGRGFPQRLAQQETQQPAAQPAQQPTQPPAQQPTQPPAQQQPGGEAIETRGLRGEVQIEVIPELGVFLIQGSAEDVAEVERIIKQIEEISAGRQPEVEIVPLKHVQASALAAVVNGIYSQILSSRGLATPGQEVPVATSLVKPNSLLLIAPKDDLADLRDWIERLDQPAEPEVQFKTFRLEHAPAQILKEALDEFYADPTGLAPVVRVTADPRSNTLVVQAAPNDMAEITEWIRRIDVADSATINDLRIFRLKNANAADLAEILQTAILGVLSPASRAGGLGGTVGQGALATGGAVAGGQTGAARLLQEATSSVLRFSVGNENERRELVSGILSEVRITAEPASNALIVSAPAKSMQLLAAVIAELDKVPETVASIQIFTLLHGDATNVATMLQTLFERQTGGAEAGPQPILQTAGPGAEGSTLVPLRFSVDRRTNSIIAAGNLNDLITVNAIIESLDTSQVIERETKVFRLEHSPAEDIATAVNNLITNEQQQLQAIDPTYVAAFEQLEREVIVVPEPVNNFLLISATKKYFDRIEALIKQLDKRPPMVAIQVLIAQVEISDHDEFGIELGIQDSLLFDRSFITGLVTTTTTTQTAASTVQDTNIISAVLDPGFNFNNQPLGNSGSDRSLANSTLVGPQGLTNFAMGRVNGELGYGGLVLSAGSENVNMLLRALKQCRRVDVLSRPQIVTLDNQPGFIQVGEQVPLITGSTLSEVGQTNQITLTNVGLIVQVTPRISPDDNIVTMVVDATKSELGPESEGIPITISATGEVVRSPRIPIITAQTTISARSGQTVIIGGLLTKDNSSLARRVPFLSDIPILGYAFRYDLDVERRNELLIILTPQVIKDDEDAELLKQVEARRMNWVLSDVVEMQGDIGVYEDDEEQDAAHAHEHLQPEMELSAPTEAPAPPPEPGHDAINYRNAQPDGQPQASTPKRRGSLARALGKLRFKPTSAREAVEKRRRGKKVLPQDKQGAVAKAAPNSTRRAPAAAARRSANPWHALKEQTVLPASRWQELEEIKKGVHSETTSD